MNMFSLEGRIALVTGAGRGIGRGVAEGLAAQGATVVCASRTKSELDETVAAIETSGGTAAAMTMDMADMDSIDAGVRQTIAAQGRIDILFNNAGMNVREPIDEVTEDAFDRIMAVNVKGLYFLTQKVARDMRSRRRGKIINVGSLTTGYALAKVSVYTASKGAVGQLTKAQAVEFGADNIQVNAICPGFVVTSLTEKMWANENMRTWGEGRVALGRLGTPQDMAGTVAFLASSAADYVTGQCIYVDGGFMAGDDWPLPPPAV